ncbi:MAG: glycosyltransferase family 4 protein [Arenicella sp.]
MRTVYYDVENTLNVPFITGIQRVTREFSKIVLSSNAQTTHRFVPVRYDHKRSIWRQLDPNETMSLLADSPQSHGLINRAQRKIKQLLPLSKKLRIKQFESDSIFLDIDSSWHSTLKRETLLPQLKSAGVRLAKLHYDIIPLLFPETTHPNTVKVFSEHFASHIKHSELFLCISNTTKNDVSHYCEEHSLTQPSLQTIQLGTHVSLNDDAATHDLSIKSFGRYLLSVGTLEPRKNYPLLLKAFEEIRQTTDLNLLIVGKTGWLAQDIANQLKAHPDYGSRIHHLEQINDAQLNSLYQNAWLSVIPSLYEGFGLPVIESLARNCPTLCSTAGSLSEVGANHVHFFSPDSVTELAQAILSLYSNSSRYQQLKLAATQYQATPWSETVKNIDQHLGELG